MKILICTDNFYPGVGGTETACFGYASALHEAGHEVVVACPDYHRGDGRSYPFRVVRMPSFMLTHNEPTTLVRRSGKKIAELAAFGPDVIHAESWSGMATVALKLGEKTGAPVVMTVHTKLRSVYLRTLHFSVFAEHFVRDAVKKMRKSDRVLTVAACMREELLSYGYAEGGNVPVIRNGAMFPRSEATEEERGAVRRKLGLGAEENVLLYAGHIVAFKNLAFLIEAFARAAERDFKGVLLLVGKGPDAARFKKLAAARGVGGRVRFTGQIEDREEMKRIYAAADLFVMPSIFDNDPIVVAEAASRGVPALTIAGTGASERIENGVSGFTCENGAEAYAEAIVSAFSDKARLREVGKTASERVPSPWRETVAAHIPIYEELIRRNPKRTRSEK